MQDPQRVEFSSDKASSVCNGLGVAGTGGTSGLGLALVRELHARGARVAFVARGRERVARLEREIARTAGSGRHSV